METNRSFGHTIKGLEGQGGFASFQCLCVHMGRRKGREGPRVSKGSLQVLDPVGTRLGPRGPAKAKSQSSSFWGHLVVRGAGARERERN